MAFTYACICIDSYCCCCYHIYWLASYILILNCDLLLIGLDDIIQEISNTPYEGIIFQARRPLILTNSILIDNLPMEKCTKNQLDVYFTNKKKSGIDSYKGIEILDDKRAIVHLENKDGKHQIWYLCGYLFYVLYPLRYAQMS